MATYAETMEADTIFNWDAFLDIPHAKQTKEFMVANDPGELATNWVTCACGNQCAIIPRNDRGEPEDPILLNLGIEFYNAIDIMVGAWEAKDDEYNEFGPLYDSQRLKAKEILQRIEIRAADIIREIMQNGQD